MEMLAFAQAPVQASRWAVLESPFGDLLLYGDGEALTGLFFARGRHVPPQDPSLCRDDLAFRAAREQLRAYFARDLTAFSLHLAPEGTAFQRRVWGALREIPYGETESYGALARRIGRPGAARAVGRANAFNPISIVVPCHRVIGQDGSLTGYGGGMDVKERLIALERGQLNWMRGSTTA